MNADQVRRGGIVISLLLLTLLLVPVQVAAQRPPTYSVGRVAGQVAVGAAFGTIAGLAGGFAGVALEGCPDENDICGLGGAVIGFSIGHVVGSGVGVYYVGHTDSTAIGFGRTLLGSVAGYGAALVITGVFFDGDDYDWLLVVPLFLGPALGAALLGNTSRHYHERYQSSGLLNINAYELYIGVPTIQREAVLGLPHTTVHLLEVRW